MMVLDPCRKYQRAQLLRVDGAPRMDSDPVIALINGELYHLDPPNTIRVYGVVDFDRRHLTLTLRPVRTLPPYAAVGLVDVRLRNLTAIGGRLYAVSPPAAVVRIDPHLGTATEIIRRLDQSYFDVCRHTKNLVAADVDDADVYELEPAAAKSEETVMAKADSSGCRVVRRRHPSLEAAVDAVAADASYRLPSNETACRYWMTCGMMMRHQQALVRDGDGCLLYLDADGRLTLHDVDLRPVGDLGRLPVDARRRMPRMWLDDRRGLLYVWWWELNAMPLLNVFSIMRD